MPKEKPDQEPAPAPATARDPQLELAALRPKLAAAQSALAKAGGYISTLRLALEGAQSSTQDNFAYQLYSLLHVIRDLEQWVIQEELALREEETQETVH